MYARGRARRLTASTSAHGLAGRRPATGRIPLSHSNIRCRITDDIRTTDEIDSAIGALTNHVRTVVEKSGREVPASSDRRRLPADVLELIIAKKAALRRASAYPIAKPVVVCNLISYGILLWGNAADIQKIFVLQKRAIHAIYKLGPHNAEIAECLADSIESQCSHASRLHDIAHIQHIEEAVQNKASNPKTICLPSRSAKSKRW
ncbi:hypothetical protein EVAR_43326_1 [Eumeta japonica]|uniref:Uncharacterized protein n=1 Tax=Eumeta variegata TaxID=151549 RepID=A0A4C1WP34_EUMVA|nr:hypothetical protein EVAR_43326_1 [Eumeta japonica]